MTILAGLLTASLLLAQQGTPLAPGARPGSSPSPLIPPAAQPIPAFRQVPRTGVIYCTTEAARRHADLTIEVRVPDIGLLEFHQIDRAKGAGRAAAVQALAQPPEWLRAGPAGTPSPPATLEV